jgi:SPP1 gp7 family putative phage head morphogenesis protein
MALAIAVEDVETGGTLRAFQRRVRAEVGDALSPARIESVYRTQIMQAYSVGQRAVLSNPLITDEFPYLLWTATHDGRTRPEHLRMETWGQNGTAVYRADDPMFEMLYPPAGYNCRCHVIPLSLEDAARHGSREAQRWLRTGVPPASPLFARKPYPITDPPDWATQTTITSVI